MVDIPRAGLAAIGVWLGGGVVAAVATWRDTNPDARLLVGSALALGLLAVLGGILIGARTHNLLYPAAGLVVSGFVTPTSFAAALNFLPIATGIWLYFWAQRSTSGRDALQPDVDRSKSP